MSQSLITAADSVLTLSVASVYPTPQTIAGFATDDAFNFGDVDVAEGQMGVDGVLSAGWVPVAFTQEITLQADSDSNMFFEQWYLAQKAARTVFRSSGTAIIPSTSRQYRLTRGILRQYSPAPQAKKLLQPRRYSIMWEAVIPSAYAGALLGA